MLNTNADTIAAETAKALAPFFDVTLVYCFEKAGVLMDEHDDDSVIRQINTESFSQLVADGVISGGMIPKVECCLEALRKGVKNVVIMDGRVPHSILMELLTDEGAGTLIRGE